LLEVLLQQIRGHWVISSCQLTFKMLARRALPRWCIVIMVNVMCGDFRHLAIHSPPLCQCLEVLD